MTPAEYYDKFLYPVDFLSQASVSTNETDALSQIREVYPCLLYTSIAAGATAHMRGMGGKRQNTGL